MLKQTILIAAMTAGLAIAAEEAPAKAAAPFDAADTWQKKCTVCHGTDGKGSAKMVKVLKAQLADLDLTTDSVAKKTDAELAGIIADGSKTNKKMTPYGKKYKPAEIDALVALIRHFAKGSSPAAPAAASPATAPSPAPAATPAPAPPAQGGAK